jgi:hypothetical protein
MAPHLESKLDVLLERLDNALKRLEGTDKQIDKLWKIIGEMKNQMEERYVTRSEFGFVKSTLVGVCSGSVVVLLTFMLQHH